MGTKKRIRWDNTIPGIAIPEKCYGSDGYLLYPYNLIRLIIADDRRAQTIIVSIVKEPELTKLFESCLAKLVSENDMYIILGKYKYGSKNKTMREFLNVSNSTISEHVAAAIATFQLHNTSIYEDFISRCSTNSVTVKEQDNFIESSDWIMDICRKHLSKIRGYRQEVSIRMRHAKIREMSKRIDLLTEGLEHMLKLTETDSDIVFKEAEDAKRFI